MDLHLFKWMSFYENAHFFTYWLIKATLLVTCTYRYLVIFLQMLCMQGHILFFVLEFIFMQNALDEASPQKMIFDLFSDNRRHGGVFKSQLF